MGDFKKFQGGKLKRGEDGEREREREEDATAAAATSAGTAAPSPDESVVEVPAPGLPPEEPAKLNHLTWPALEEAVMRQLTSAATAAADPDTPLDDAYPFQLGSVAITAPWATQWTKNAAGRRLSGRGRALASPAAPPKRRDSSASTAAVEQMTWGNLLAPIFSKEQEANPARIILTTVSITPTVGLILPSTEQAHTLLILVDTQNPSQRFCVFLVHFAANGSPNFTKTITGKTLLKRNVDGTDVPQLQCPADKFDASSDGLAATDVWLALHSIVTALFVKLPEQQRTLPVQLCCCQHTTIPLEKRLLNLVTYLTGSTTFMSQVLLDQTTAALETVVAHLVGDEATQWTRSNGGSIKHDAYWRDLCTVATLMPGIPGLAPLTPTQSASSTPSLDALIDRWFGEHAQSADLPDRTDRTAVLAALWLDKLAEVARMQGACFGLSDQRTDSLPAHQQKLAGEVAGLIAMLKKCTATANQEEGATFIKSLGEQQLREAEDTASWLARVSVKLNLFSMPLDEKFALICRTALTLDRHQNQLFFFLCAQVAAEKLAQAEAANTALQENIASVARARVRVAQQLGVIAALQPQEQAQEAIDEAERTGKAPPADATSTFSAEKAAQEEAIDRQADNIVSKMQALLSKLKETIGDDATHPLMLFVTALTEMNIKLLRTQLHLQGTTHATTDDTTASPGALPVASKEIAALQRAIQAAAEGSEIEKLVIEKCALLMINSQLRELIALQETIRQDDSAIQRWQTWYRAFQRETFDASLPSGAAVSPASPISVTTAKKDDGGYKVTLGNVEQYVLQGKWRDFVRLIAEEVHRKYQTEAWQRFATSVRRTIPVGFGADASSLVFSEVMSNPPALTQEAAEEAWRTRFQDSSPGHSTVIVTAILPCYDSLAGHRSINEPVWAWLITVIPKTSASSASACLIICGTQTHYAGLSSWQMKFSGFAIKDTVKFVTSDGSHGGREAHSHCSIHGTLARALGKVLSQEKGLSVLKEERFPFVLPVYFLHAPEPDVFCSALNHHLTTNSTLHQSLPTPADFEALRKALQSRLHHT